LEGVAPSFDLQPSTNPSPAVLTPSGEQHLGKLAAPQGMVPWRNAVSPRPGAEVWATAGGAPFAVFGKAGEGRVLALLGTALGEAPKGQTAFFEAPGWPRLLTRMLHYLARGKPPPNALPPASTARAAHALRQHD
jgi:hypothetical protein